MFCPHYGITLPPFFTYFHTFIDILSVRVMAGMHAEGWVSPVPIPERTLRSRDDSVVASILQQGRWRTVCIPFGVYGTLRRGVLPEVTLQSLEPLAGGFSSVLHLPLCLWLPVVWLMFAQQHPVCIRSHTWLSRHEGSVRQLSGLD